MAKQLQLRRGTTAENDAFTGAIGEVTVDTTLKQLRVHDGETQGGIKVANVAEVVDDLATKQDTSNLVTAVSSASTDTQYPSAKLLYDALATKADVSALANKADKATTLAGYGITDATKTDLSNLTSVGKNITNWSSNVTNCITEIPQDIKLELNAGTLTLKSGSKLYKADGTYIITTQDYTTTGTNADGVAFYDIDNDVFAWRQKSECYSQASAPTNTQYMLWFDTTNNIVKVTVDYGTTWATCTLPVGIFTADSTKITSIDQVFNGFGFIGSAVFMYPGVKGLIPNGRNADGSLKNTEWVASQVITSTLTFGAQSYYFGVYNNNQELAFYGKTVTKYDEKNNVIIDTHPDPDVIRTGWSFFGECIADSNSKIKAFTPKTVFHALDYSDSNYIAHCAMPGDRYIDLTLGANYTSYTMPDDGYLFLYKSADAANQYITISNNATDMAIHQWVPASGGGCAGYLPVKKGDSIMITYTAGGAVVYFRFIYANGATKEF